MKTTLGDYKYKELFKIYESMFIEETRGEYWITDSGTVIYADGDIGDMNHEAIIIDELTRIFLNIFDIDDGEPNPVRFYYEQIGQYLAEEDPEFNEEVYLNDEEEYILNYIKKHHLDMFNNSEKQLQDAWRTAYGNTDARVYGLKYLHWKRLLNNNIQTQTLSQNDLEAILRGLGEAYPDIDEENPEEVLFNVEVMATGEYYTDVPLSVLDEKDLLAIHRYA